VAGLAAFLNLAVEEPAAASLAAVESLTLGAAGVARRERALEVFGLLVHQSFNHSPSEREVSEPVVWAIVAGIRGVAYQRLRQGRREELPSVVEELVDWALRYQEPESEAARRGIARAAIATEPEPEPDGEASSIPGWEEPPDRPRSRAALTQRERIVRAAAQVVVERGYEALSIPAISAAAGTSNQTFYEHFANKRDALLAAFEILGAEALGKAATAFEREDDYAEAIGASLRALLEHIASNALFARLAFFELPTAGPVALDHADAMLESFGDFLGPGRASSGIGAPLPRSVLEAIPSGIWAVIQHEIVHGRRESLPQLAPEIARIVLASFDRR
jgi:AcrR family transcriptional regulator